MTPAWKPPPGPIVAVELDVEGEDEDVRREDLRGDPEDDGFIRLPAGLLRRASLRRPQPSRTPVSKENADAAVKITAVSPIVS
jgi:hypothetical protein